MSNATKLFEYQVRATDRTTIRNIMVRADTSASTLILAGLSNQEATDLTSPNTFSIVIEGRGGPKSKKSHARTVTVIMTAAGAGLSVGSRVVVPVFRISRWASYVEGQTGTYAGVGCRYLSKMEGLPDSSGMIR